MNTTFKSSMVIRTLRILIIVLVIGGFSGVAFADHYWYDYRDFGIYTGCETTCSPTFVGFNGKLYYFFKKSDNQVWYMRSDDGGFLYYGFYTLPGASTSHPVAGEVFNGKMYIAYKSATTNDIYLTSSTDGVSGNWSTPAIISGKTTSTAPALTVFNNKLQLVTKGAANNNIYVCASTDGATWSTSYQIPSVTTAEYPSTTAFNGKIYVAYKGDGNNNIYISSSLSGQTTWNAAYTVPNIGTSVTPTIHAYLDRMYMIHKSISGLEDFLETGIKEFEMLKSKQRVTDDAALVEFDFRCQIENSFVILDMQQWYKRDVTKRFYLYHALNSGLQLEQLPSKRVLYEYSYDKEKVKDLKDYQALQPVLTLVWMVDDTMGFKDDYVAYAMTPEIVTTFIKNENLWHKPEIIEILEERSRVLEVLNNQSKELSFLAKNRLIFIMQRNIVKNKNKAKYVKWFEFAEKTKNPDNKEEDFLEYMDDEIFCEIIKRLDKKWLTENDYTYIKNEQKIREEVERFERQVYTGGWEDGLEKGKEEGLKAGMEKGREEGLEKGRDEGIKQGEKNKALDIAGRLKEKGIDIRIIAEASGLPLEEIVRL